MSWIFIATAAQFFLAVVAVFDKYIVTNKKMMPRPFVYAFYTCLFAGVWVFAFVLGLLPIPLIGSSVPSFSNVEIPSLEVVALSLLAAYTFFFALVSLYSGFEKADASDVVPVVGAVSAVGSFGLSYLFLGTSLTSNFTIGIFLLGFGTLIASRLRFSWRVAANSLHAGLFFALHYITLKGLFNVTTFDNGFFWSRIMFVLFALSILLIPTYFEKIKKQTKETSRLTSIIIATNKLLAGMGTILILKATELGDVAVVQALGGLQFIFVLMIGIFFGTKTKEICIDGDCKKHPYILQKTLFTLIITLGFFALFIDFGAIAYRFGLI